MPGTKALLAASLFVVAGIGLWGIVDPDGALAVSSTIVERSFRSRGWFVMVTVTGTLLFCLWLAFSRFGNVRLGQ
ncbi:MAG: BCCT family transporter, partial [Rubricoccaceae bacterium]|nr:BCCT family transporter [Rubricoccaceae bacterium]